MKKLLVMLLGLSVANLQAQLYDGVDPCKSPAVTRYVVDEIFEDWITSGAAASALFCGAMIATGVATATDDLRCISSAPVTAAGLPTAPGSTVSIAFNDSRLVFPVLISTLTNSALISQNNSIFQPVRVKNLQCAISASRTPAVVYYVPMGR